MSCADHLAGVGQCLLGEVKPTQHAGNFLDPFTAIQCGDSGVGFLGAARLVYKQVMVTLCRNLWQVGHGQYLAPLAEAAQQLADHFCGRPADADVHFVEHQGRNA